MIPYQRNAFIFATIVAIGGFVFGLDAALISGTVNYISQEFGLTDLQLGMAVSAPGLGVLVALPIAGWASNLLGRKQTLQIIAALYLISAIGSALAPSFWALVAARFLGGLAFSSITLASMYIGEIAPPQWRGKLVSMTQINIVVGPLGGLFCQLPHSAGHQFRRGLGDSLGHQAVYLALDAGFGDSAGPDLVWFVVPDPPEPVLAAVQRTHGRSRGDAA